MKLEKTACPYCGAGLKILPGQRTVECEYCGNTVLVTGSETASPAQERQVSDLIEPDRPAARIDWAPVSPPPGGQAPDRGAQGNPAPDSRRRTNVHAPRKRSLFPPPGFRSRNIAHIIFAVIGYLFIIAVAFSFDEPLDTFFFLLSSLSVVDLCTDWTGLFSRFPGVFSQNTLIRFVMKTFWSIVLFIAWMVVLALISTLVS